MITGLLSLFVAFSANAQTEAPDIKSGEYTLNRFPGPDYDVCVWKGTMQTLEHGECHEILRPVTSSGKEQFKLRALFLTHDPATAKDKQTVILVPGGPGESSDMFRFALNQKDAINTMLGSGLNLNVVLYDPRGTGTSTFSQPVSAYGSQAINSQIMTDDLLALANEVSPNKPVVLMAHSAGGSTAVQLALQNPSRISKLILLATTTSPRQMAEVNMTVYSMRANDWERFMKSPQAASLNLADLDKRYRKLEDVFVQQQKARLLKNYIHNGFSTKMVLNPGAKHLLTQTVSELRKDLVVAMQKDDRGQGVVEFIESKEKMLADIQKADPQELIPAELRISKLQESKLDVLPFEGSELIKVLISCSEGMTSEDLKIESYLDGITLNRFCNGLHAKSEEAIVRNDLSQVKMPVLYLEGAKDFQVPMYVAQQNVSQLPNVKLVVSQKAGHAFFYDDMGGFYYALSDFLKP